MFASSVGSAPISWDLVIEWPVKSTGSTDTGYDPDDHTRTAQRYVPRTGVAYGPDPGGAGGFGATGNMAWYRGKFGGHTGSTGALSMQSFWWPWMMPFRGPGNVNPGALFDPATELVCVMDWTVAFGTVVPLSSTGLFLVPCNQVFANVANLPFGGAPKGGMGVVGNGLGGINFETYDNTGAVLGAANIGVHLADHRDWFSVRLVWRPASSASHATLEVSTVGTIVYQDTFGSATLPFPDTWLAGSYCFYLYAVASNPGDLHFTTKARFGRFLPDGTAVQED